MRDREFVKYSDTNEIQYFKTIQRFRFGVVASACNMKSVQFLLSFLESFTRWHLEIFESWTWTWAWQLCRARIKTIMTTSFLLCSPFGLSLHFVFIISDISHISSSRAQAGEAKTWKSHPSCVCQSGQEKYPQEKHFLELFLLGFPSLHDSTNDIWSILCILKVIIREVEVCLQPLFPSTISAWAPPLPCPKQFKS